VEEVRFLADAMLGRLARWLRVLGFDTTYDPTAPDSELVARASAEGRLLLTRDRHLLRELRPARALEVQSSVPLEQLRQVVDGLQLSAPAELFTRCILCNAPLTDVPTEERASVVPLASQGLPGPVRRCDQCRRVYWHGSHVRRMRVALERALPGWLP
jgi:uncharacterized protein with PIN domain